MRRPASRGIVVAGLVLVLPVAAAACIEVRGDEPPDAASTAAPDPLGTVTMQPGAPIRIAVLGDQLGAESSMGQDAARGARLAVDFLDGALDGQPGRLLGHPVELVEMHAGCGRSGEPLLEDGLPEGIVGVIGPVCTRATTGGAMTGLTESGVVTISPSATESSLIGSADPDRSFFRTAYNDRLEGRVVADLGVEELGIDRAAVVTGRIGSSGAATTFRSTFEEAGGVVALSGTFSGGTHDVGRLLRAVALGRPEMIYLVARDRVCEEAATQASLQPGLRQIPIVGSVGCFGPSFSLPPAETPGGLFVAGPDLSRYQEDGFYRLEFLPAYQDQFGTAPTGAFHAHAYDATLILLDAIDRVARAEQGSLTIGRSLLRDEIVDTSEVAGLSGTISCSETGDCMPEASIAIYRVPDAPLEGGPTVSEPVFIETVSLEDLAP